MSRQLISQREARRLKKRVEQLESMELARRSRWLKDYPGGINVWNIFNMKDSAKVVQTCRALGHAVVVIDHEDSLMFFAIPHKEQKL